MQSLPPDPKRFNRLRWIEQISESHCGPAVVQMLLENIGVDASQEAITEAAGATPVDFAYAVHSDVGHACVGAKVGGRIVPLRYTLRNGDVVEILTQTGHMPSKDWLALVKTSRARNKIKHVINANERLKAIEVQKNECSRWDELHQLIGSADGKKFRNFAQGLTFELMVAHANRQLQKMSDRYILVRDNSEPLELNVIDNYQAGEIRSTKNLSGGESFIASLALSLGLSSMASRNVRVDSLFLDEGFGTLDEDALETALETLSGLQQDGKFLFSLGDGGDFPQLFGRVHPIFRTPHISIIVNRHQISSLPCFNRTTLMI